MKASIILLASCFIAFGQITNAASVLKRHILNENEELANEVFGNK